MIESRIQIENGEIEDFYAKWGFIYMSGDHRFAPPEKKRDTTSYIEEAGEHTDPRTVDDAFDYSAKFLIETPNSNNINANSKIKAWNDAVRERIPNSDIKRCKTVTFYDDYKRVKVVGIPEIIADVEATDYFRRKGMDCIVFTLTIHVSNPNLCDFDTKTPVKYPISLSLTTDGESLYLNTSQPLSGGVRVALLRSGRKRNKWKSPKHANDPNRYIKHPCRLQWHVTSAESPVVLGDGNKIVGLSVQDGGERVVRELINYTHWDASEINGSEHLVAWIRKTRQSNYIVPAVAGNTAKIAFGIAIYDGRTRLSNVARFWSNVAFHKTALDWDDFMSAPEDYFTQFLSV